MDHSAVIYLLNSEQKFVGVIPYQENDDSALAKLEGLVAAAPTS
jgi:cytochrome oxidase Cu insertion factor (SCO1/SenC/PrrC family)